LIMMNSPCPIDWLLRTRRLCPSACAKSYVSRVETTFQYDDSEASLGDERKILNHASAAVASHRSFA
jgi:hypothetical protein